MSKRISLCSHCYNKSKCQDTCRECKVLGLNKTEVFEKGERKVIKQIKLVG